VVTGVVAGGDVVVVEAAVVVVVEAAVVVVVVGGVRSQPGVVKVSESSVTLPVRASARPSMVTP
jgi:hypothetical protein